MPLEIDLDIPHGNAADLDVQTHDDGATVSFAAAAHGGPERAWFCLRVRQSRRGRKTRGSVTLVLKHLDTMLGESNPEKLRPVIRYTGEQDWQRMAPGKPAEAEDGRMGAWWRLDAPEAWFDVALCYPYGQTQLRQLFGDLGDQLRFDAIGVSQGDDQLLRVANRYGEVGSDRPGIYLTARQHAGETPGSWVLDGMLRRFTEMGDDAPTVWAVPLADVDGVERGDYGKDAFPYDLNRAWGRPPMRHEVMTIQHDARLWAKRCRPMAMIDLHAPGIAESDGLYAFVSPCGQADDGSSADQTTLALAAPLREALSDLASDDFARVANYPSRWDTPNATAWFREALEVPALSIECPYQGVADRPFEVKDYREAGARLAGGLVAWLRGR